MAREWRETARQSVSLVPTWPSVVIGTKTIFASGSRLLTFDGVAEAGDHDVGFEVMSLAANARGMLACNGVERTVILDPDLEPILALSGPERPAPNQNGSYALTERHFVCLRGRRDAELVLIDLDRRERVAVQELDAGWLGAPSEFIVHSEGSIYAGCAQESLAMVVRIFADKLGTEALAFRGAFLGFLADRTCYVAEWDGRITLSSFPTGDLVRSMQAPSMTPITVPNAFTRVAATRGATVATVEDMFDDVFVDARGKPAPFATWSAALDGETVIALHVDGTLRRWQPSPA